MQLIPEGRRPESRFRHQLQDSRLIGDDSPLQIPRPKTPCYARSLDRDAADANSRFFTNCYLNLSHFDPYFAIFRQCRHARTSASSPRIRHRTDPGMSRRGLSRALAAININVQYQLVGKLDRRSAVVSHANASAPSHASQGRADGSLHHSVGLPAEKGRYLQLIVIDRVMHSCGSPVMIKALRTTSLGILRHRIGPTGNRSRRHPLGQRWHLRANRWPLGQ